MAKKKGRDVVEFRKREAVVEPIDDAVSLPKPVPEGRMNSADVALARLTGEDPGRSRGAPRPRKRGVVSSDRMPLGGT